MLDSLKLAFHTCLQASWPLRCTFGYRSNLLCTCFDLFGPSLPHQGFWAFRYASFPQCDRTTSFFNLLQKCLLGWWKVIVTFLRGPYTSFQLVDTSKHKLWCEHTTSWTRRAIRWPVVCLPSTSEMKSGRTGRTLPVSTE